MFDDRAFTRTIRSIAEGSFAPLDAVLAPGLRKAFPMPEGTENDDRFGWLLEALAERDRRRAQG